MPQTDRDTEPEAVIGKPRSSNKTECDEPVTKDDHGCKHYKKCNEGLHTPEEVEKSQKEFDWRIVEPYDQDPWVSWDSLGLQVKDPKHLLCWRRSADMDISWTGVCLVKPGQELPAHIHAPPELYWMLKGELIVTINGIRNRVTPFQCVSLPPNVPHGLRNESNEEALFVYIYLPIGKTVKPDETYKWKFLEEI